MILIGYTWIGKYSNHFIEYLQLEYKKGKYVGFPKRILLSRYHCFGVIQIDKIQIVFVKSVLHFN